MLYLNSLNNSFVLEKIPKGMLFYAKKNQNAYM